MRYRELLVKLTEASMPFGKPVNTKGLTFGFEAEFVCSRETFADEIDINDISEDDLIHELGADEDVMNEKFSEWKEETDQPDAELHDWIEDIGLVQWWNQSLADGNWWYTVTDERLLRYPTWSYGADMFGDDIRDYFGYDIVVANNEDHHPNKHDYSRWFIENDPSVGDDEYAFEVVSPIFDDYDEFVKTMSSFLTWVDKRYKGGIYTDSSTGLHINIGMEDAKNKIDVLKILLFSGEDWMAKHWRGDDITHTGAILPKLKDGLPISVKEASLYAMTFLRNFDDKAFAVNLMTLIQLGYVEFRPIGNKDYQKKIPEALQHINRFVQLIRIASNPDSYRQEYARKLGKLIGGGPVTGTNWDVYDRTVNKWMDEMRFSPYDRRMIAGDDGRLNITPHILLRTTAYMLANKPNKFPRQVLVILIKKSGINAAQYADFRERYEERLPWDIDRNGWDLVKLTFDPIFMPEGAN